MATTPLLDLQDDGATNVAGRSPTQLAIARFRADKLSMVSFVRSTLIVLCAIAAPILVAVGVLNPNEFHQELLVRATASTRRAASVA